LSFREPLLYSSAPLFALILTDKMSIAIVGPFILIIKRKRDRLHAAID